jgi:hypothetical protein
MNHNRAAHRNPLFASDWPHGWRESLPSSARMGGNRLDGREEEGAPGRELAGAGNRQRRYRISLAFLVLLTASLVLASKADWRLSAERKLFQAEKQLAKDTNSVQANWEFGRACFDLAEYSTNNTERADLAKRGIEASRRAVAGDPASAAAHYYLALNIGQLARTRYLSALKLVDELEHELLRARELDSKIFYAGPERTLGLLYRDAPVIGSVGSKRKAEQHLQAAAQLCPLYMDNRLNLAESYLKWGDRNGASRELKTAEESWPVAREKFSGPEWEPDWADWEARRLHLDQKLRQGLPGLKSPREKEK